MSYVVKWNGKPITEIRTAAYAYCKKEIPICKDLCKFIDHAEYVRMKERGEIKDDHGNIKEGEIGMIAPDHAVTSYDRSWEDLSHCYRDFIAGYEACEAKYKKLADWDEAVLHEKARNSFMKETIRSIEFNFDHYMNYYNLNSLQVCTELQEQYKEVVKCTVRVKRGDTIFILSIKETGQKTNQIILNICRAYNAIGNCLDDPREVEYHRYGWDYLNDCPNKFTKGGKL